MRKKGFLIIMFLLSIGFLIIGCNGNDDVKPVLSVEKETLVVGVGENVKIVSTITGTKNNLEKVYVSNNDAVATVSNDGTINGITVGDAKITVSLKDYPDVNKVINVNVVEPLSITGESQVNVGGTITLTAKDINSPDNKVFWESSDNNILTVDSNGVVTGVAGGIAKVIITSLFTAKKFEKEIKVNVVDPVSVEIEAISLDKVTLSSVILLNAAVTPAEASQEVIWSSSDIDIATVNADGKVTPISAGTVTIKATVPGTVIVGEITFTVQPTPSEIFAAINAVNPVISYDVMFWGNDDPTKNAVYDVFGSVSNFFFSDLVIDETSYVLPTTAQNYSGEEMESIEFIVVHDTASAGGGAKANAGWLVNPGNTGTSWHYTVGNDGVFHSLPNNIVGWHAGDGTRSWGLTDTGIKATTKYPTVTASTDGFWVINGNKSTLTTPRTNTGAITTSLTRSGIYTEVGANGNYFIGTTYFNTGYGGTICNTGGGANGIGIESAMNNGSDLYLTWHYLAKLVAKLMVDHDLPINRVRQHNFYSNKDCPRTMRNAGLWENFLKMVQAEYLVLTQLKDYTIKFTSNNLTYVSNTGRIINLPDVKTTVSYKVTFTDKNGVSDSELFRVDLPAKQ